MTWQSRAPAPQQPPRFFNAAKPTPNASCTGGPRRPRVWGSGSVLLATLLCPHHAGGGMEEEGKGQAAAFSSAAWCKLRCSPAASAAGARLRESKS